MAMFYPPASRDPLYPSRSLCGARITEMLSRLFRRGSEAIRTLIERGLAMGRVGDVRYFQFRLSIIAVWELSHTA